MISKNYFYLVRIIYCYSVLRFQITTPTTTTTNNNNNNDNNNNNNRYFKTTQRNSIEKNEKKTINVKQTPTIEDRNDFGVIYEAIANHPIKTSKWGWKYKIDLYKQSNTNVQKYYNRRDFKYT